MKENCASEEQSEEEETKENYHEKVSNKRHTARDKYLKM